MNNKTLGLIFAGLLIIFLITRYFSGNKNRSFDPDLLALDKDRITKLEVTQKDQTAYTLEKVGENWIGKKGDLEITAEGNTVQSTLDLLSSLKILRVATRDESKWSSYEADDATARARVKIYEGGKLLKDYVIGGFKFDQTARSAKSYIRLAGEKEVYVLDGFSTLSLGQGFDAYRDKKVLSLAPEAVSKISWQSGELDQSIEKTIAGWQGANGELLDSTKVAGLVNGLSNFNASAFKDDYSPAQETGNSGALFIQSSDQSAPVQLSIKEVSGAEKALVVISSQRPDTYFAMDSAAIVGRFFKPLNEYQ